jgi:hypothetical protein
MKHTFKTLFIFSLAVSLAAGTGCKTSKKTITSKADKEAKLAREKAEQDRKRAKDERARKEAEEKAHQQNGQKQELQDSFAMIVNATNTAEADKTIKLVLNYFSSSDIPVLIIINKSGDIIDYDKPTTIKHYLEYLKDTKKNMNSIYQITKDDAGKIKELTLIKK